MLPRKGSIKNFISYDLLKFSRIFWIGIGISCITQSLQSYFRVLNINLCELVFTLDQALDRILRLQLLNWKLHRFLSQRTYFSPTDLINLRPNCVSLRKTGIIVRILLTLKNSFEQS